FDLIADAADLLAHLVKLVPHEPLDRVNRVVGVNHGLPLCGNANETLSVVLERNDARHCTTTLCRSDHNRFAGLHDRNHRVGRAQINSYCLSHDVDYTCMRVSTL